MIKRTIYVGNPAYLCCNNEQMQIEKPAEKDPGEKAKTVTISIEDIGVLILDHHQITISHHLMHRLLENNCALITCDDKHMPAGLMLNLNGNTLQQERFDAQIASSVPFKKQLWANTVSTKILN